MIYLPHHVPTVAGRSPTRLRSPDHVSGRQCLTVAVIWVRIVGSVILSSSASRNALEMISESRPSPSNGR